MPVKTVARTGTGRMDLDGAIDYMIESIAEMSRKMAESDAIMAKSKAESDAKIAESDAIMAKSKAESDAIMAKSKAESDAIMAKSRRETDAKIAESQAKTDRAIQRLTDRVDLTSEYVRELTLMVNSGFSRIGNRLGYLVEFIVAPSIRQEMNKMNHNFRYARANKIFMGTVNGQKSELTEVDLFLSNGTEVMAVEVKTSLTLGRVQTHLDRLNTLRKFEKHTKIQGKKLFGAVVGLFIDNAAREYAKENGLYVLEILEDEKRLKVEKPTKRRVW